MRHFHPAHPATARHRLHPAAPFPTACAADSAGPLEPSNLAAACFPNSSLRLPNLSACLLFWTVFRVFCALIRYAPLRAHRVRLSRSARLRRHSNLESLRSPDLCGAFPSASTVRPNHRQQSSTTVNLPLSTSQAAEKSQQEKRQESIPDSTRQACSALFPDALISALGARVVSGSNLCPLRLSAPLRQKRTSQRQDFSRHSRMQAEKGRRHQRP